MLIRELFILFCLTSGLVILLVSCSAPSDPEFNNPYDQEGSGYIAGPVLETRVPSDIMAATAVGEAAFIENYGKPVTQKGICWSTSQSPDIENSCTEEGAGNEDFTSELTGLNPEEEYYVRAYATNEDTTVYGNERKFSTLSGVPVFSEPSVETTFTTATVNISLNDRNGLDVSDWGICYDVSGSPDENSTCLSALNGTFKLTDSTTQKPSAASNITSRKEGSSSEASFTSQDKNTSELNSDEQFTTSASHEAEIFSSDLNEEGHGLEVTLYKQKNKAFIELSGLQANQVYYLRPFAVGTLLGLRFNDEQETSFITADASPAVETLPAEQIRAFSARLNGDVVSDGGAAITERGICYAAGGEPDLSDTCVAAAPGSGSFGSIADNLEPDQSYNIRAYASNIYATGWGSTETFTTRDGRANLGNISFIEENAFTALAQIQVTNDGGADLTEAGVCYSSSSIPPNFEDTCVAVSEAILDEPMEVNITGILPDTTFYVRAYAITQVATNWGPLGNISGTSQVRDAEGNMYDLIYASGHYWMAENLKATKYRLQSIDIPKPATNEAWQTNMAGAYAIYDPEQTDGISSETQMEQAYGLLYNWHAVNNSLGICPEGMKVPSKEDWQALIANSGGSETAGGKLKSGRTTPQWPHPRWDSPNEGATNESGFSGLPAGLRAGNTADFERLGAVAYWWSSSSWSGTGAYSYGAEYDTEAAFQRIRDQSVGLPVRCINE